DERAADEDERPKRIDGAAATAGQEADAEEAGEDPGAREEGDADVEEHAVDHEHEERDARDDERGEPGRDVLLGESDSARLDDEQEEANKRGGAPLAPAGPLDGDLAAAPSPRVQ